MKTQWGKNLKGKRVLLRVNFDVPLSEDGKILDDSRIKTEIPFIYDLSIGLYGEVPEIILLSHLGRPKGKVVENLKLKVVADHIRKNFSFGFKDETKIKEKNGFPAYEINSKIFLLENIRFDPREEKNDPDLAKELASMGDVFINDAFSVCHRIHASTVGIAKYLKSFAGINLDREVKNLSRLLRPKRPFVCVMGGVKVPDKIEMILKLSRKTDYFLFGGVMANTFLAASGIDLKDSLIAQDKISLAKTILKKLEKKIILPFNFVYGNLEGKRAVLDIGEKDVKNFTQYIKKAKTIFWNGNLGLTENPKYAKGSLKIAKAIIASKAFSVAGGGDTIAFLDQYSLANKFSFISLGGGAALEFLAGKKLPGLEALK